MNTIIPSNEVPIERDFIAIIEGSNAKLAAAYLQNRFAAVFHAHQAVNALPDGYLGSVDVQSNATEMTLVRVDGSPLDPIAIPDGDADSGGVELALMATCTAAQAKALARALKRAVGDGCKLHDMPGAYFGTAPFSTVDMDVEWVWADDPATRLRQQRAVSAADGVAQSVTSH